VETELGDTSLSKDIQSNTIALDDLSQSNSARGPSLVPITERSPAPLVGGSPALQACPANPNDLVSNVVLSTGGVASTGASQNTVEVSLALPLSLAKQNPDVIVIGNNLRIPTSHFKVTLQTGSTAKTLTLSAPVSTLSGSGRKTLLINIVESLPESAKTITVTLSDLAFECPNSTSPTLIAAASQSGNVTPNATLQASDIDILNKANKDAAAKRSSDKNYRLGFSAAKGDDGKAQGAADIAINKTLFGGSRSGTIFDFFDQADIALQMKKSSAEDTDPRHLTLGLNLRRSFLIDSRLQKADAGQPRSATIAARDKSKGFFRVLSITEGLNFEGEAFDFRTSNFVSDTNFEVASIAKKLGSGFYNFNIFAGPEIGRSLAKPDAAVAVGATPDQLSQVNWITRFKAGGEFTLKLMPAGSDDKWGVELNLGYVNRYLFTNEVITQESMKDGQTTKKLVTVEDGNKAWRQADLKVFLFGNDKQRYGVKFSYSKGQLPPTFTPTKGFQFGVVIESKDDTKGGQPVSNK